jgi:hypothetical protein
LSVVARAEPRPVDSVEPFRFLATAEECLRAARDELALDRAGAASKLALYAGVNAADAVCGARLAHRAAADDMHQILVLLGHCGDEGLALADDLRVLIVTSPAEVKSLGRTGRAAGLDAVERATRAVQIASEVVRGRRRGRRAAAGA